jgi:hypothetical protein
MPEVEFVLSVHVGKIDACQQTLPVSSLRIIF